LRHYVDQVLAAGTTDNGVFACKVMWSSMSDLLERLEREQLTFLEVFPAPRFVWLVRDDVAAQAVSWAKALQTGQWHYWDPPPDGRALQFDDEAIAALAREIEEHNAAWNGWFADIGVTPLVVRFEELVADKEAATSRVLEFLELDLAPGVQVVEQTSSTHDDVNDEWLSWFRGGGG
jgi:LPS sulfotransferase NodH